MYKETLSPWIDLNKALSYSTGLFYFFDTVRNIGKTWAVKKRIWRRAFKHGKKTIYVRRFRKEVSECSATFYQSADIIKHCKGLIPYNPDTKKGNCKQQGRTFFIKRNQKWTWFLKIVSLTEYAKMRSADDVDCDTIIFDEYTTTPEKYKQYRGNEVEHFIDLSISIARHHNIRCIFLGNKESIDNPYYNYFGLKPLPTAFQGTRTYKQGTLVRTQFNDPIELQEDVTLCKFRKLLDKTAYGQYMHAGEYKTHVALKWYKTPAKADGYLQLYWKKKLLAISTYKGYIYVNDKPDIMCTLFTDQCDNKYPHQKQLIKKLHAKLFNTLYHAVQDNRVRYSSETVFNNIQPFYKWLNIFN